jgi:hypothetical protein
MVAAVEAVRLDDTVDVRGGASEWLAVEVECLLECANGWGILHVGMPKNLQVAGAGVDGVDREVL